MIDDTNKNNKIAHNEPAGVNLRKQKNVDICIKQMNTTRQSNESAINVPNPTTSRNEQCVHDNYRFEILRVP